MNAEILKKIAHDRKINLKHFDHVNASINENYTKVIITFFNLQVCGGERTWCNRTIVKLSVASILKNAEKTGWWPEDYETNNGSRWIHEIR